MKGRDYAPIVSSDVATPQDLQCRTVNVSYAENYNRTRPKPFHYAESLGGNMKYMAIGLRNKKRKRKTGRNTNGGKLKDDERWEFSL